MATNREIATAKDYHERTKHSPASIRTALHRLDWANKPALFKVYEDLPTYPLPKGFGSPKMATLDAISSSGEGGDLDLAGLAQVLYFTAGITKEARTPDGSSYLFRAAACAGALYPIEVYVVSRALNGLPAGVYHFAPHEFALTQLRAGDFRAVLVSGDEEAGKGPAATVVLTSIFWRSAWKYQARSYRYAFWDSGTMLANLLATASSAGIDASVNAGFVDTEPDRLLGVDGDQEGTLCLIPLGHSEQLPVETPVVANLHPKSQPLSREEVEYPLIREMHHASYLSGREEAQAWKGSINRRQPRPSGRKFPLAFTESRGMPLGATVLRRGSTRHFRRTPIALDALGSILHDATRGFEADFLKGPNTRLVDIYVIVNEVEDLPGGAYSYSGGGNHLELLKEGEFREWSGFLGLEQALPADASAVVFFLADLGRILSRFGNRGYRVAQLEAGILGGRMYLAAYALGLGATGLTFYDDEIVEFFSPHAEGKDAIFMVALGKAVRVRSNVRAVPAPFAKEGQGGQSGDAETV